jgi:catechol 2,3-dioxygenase-like lactoylglutathione lyase family enzyme
MRKAIGNHQPRGEALMLDHVSVGVRDIAAARRFYDAALSPLGYKCLAEGETYLGYGEKAPQFWLLAAEHPVPADSKSGLHFCFNASSPKAVDAFHASALKSGGRDNGKPGIRPDYSDTYYAAFVVDPDGYRIEAYCSRS